MSSSHLTIISPTSPQTHTPKPTLNHFSHDAHDYELEQRNKETLKSNAERQASQQLDNAKYGLG